MYLKKTLILTLISLPLLSIITVNKVWGQSITPANDGTGTIVNQQGNQFNIEGGTLSGDGANLFHSLQKFGLNAEQIANFLANPSIRNILTRVVGGDPSVINGLIQITGGNPNLFIMNPAGIIFGPNAQLNIPADFTATTATGIGFANNNWFNALGENNYSQLIGNPSQFAFDLSQPGSIINRGNLTLASGHNLTLLAGNVINTGTLNAPGGNITIAAIPGTNRIRISQPGNLVSLEIIDPRPTNNNTSNISTIKPPNLATLLTQGANGLELGVTVNADGTIQLTQSQTSLPITTGTLITTGTINTASTTQIGGNITLIGERIGVIDSQINASGNQGGGNIRIGGDYRGQGTIPNAERTLITDGSTLNSNGLETGNGGQIIVWANDLTGFYGNINSRGGRLSGNGGLVEVSGKNQLIFAGNVDTSAPVGKFGTLFLDPLDITIKNGRGDGTTDGTNTFKGNNTGQVGQVLSNNNSTDTAPSIIFESELEGLSGNTNIVLEALRNITIENLADNALTFQRGTGSIVFRTNTIQTRTGTFQMSPDDTIIAPGRNLSIERLGNLLTSGCALTNSCRVIVGNIDTSSPTVGGSVNITARGSTGNNVPSIQVGKINASSTLGSGGNINLQTRSTNGSIVGTVKVDGVNFDPNDTSNITRDQINTREGATINNVEINFGNNTAGNGNNNAGNGNNNAGNGNNNAGNGNNSAGNGNNNAGNGNNTAGNGNNNAGNGNNNPPPLTVLPPVGNNNPPPTINTGNNNPPPTINIDNNSPPPTINTGNNNNVTQLLESERGGPVINLNNAYTSSNQANNIGANSGNIGGANSTVGTNNKATAESVEKDFGTDFANHLGIEPVAPLTLEQTQTRLQQAELATKLKPALVYIVFKPQSNIVQSPQNTDLWTFNSGKPAKQIPLNRSEKNTDQLELILISSSGEVLRIPITDVTRKQVISVAEQFQQTVTNPRRPTAHRGPGKQLYQWFIEPLESELQARKIDTLVFIVDEGLRSVPMAALYDGSKFLIEHYSMGLMPSLALTDTRYKDMTKDRVLAMGASQFNQQNPLPGVPLELSVIADRIWKGQSYLNNNFTLSNLQKAHASGEFGIIHLATHANFETGKLNNSYIQLWNSQLTLDQLKDLNLGNPPVELLVLSACRTALGNRESELGFAGAAVLARVKTVLGSLWEVSDDGTLGLMTRFYEQLRDVPLKVTAIRQAQLSLLRGEVYLKDGYLITPKNRLPLPPQLAELTAAQSISPHAGLLTHPYYWSGFTLIGSPW